MTLPAPILAVLAAFRSTFTAPTWRKVLVLVVGTVLAPSRRTVTAALRQMGLESDPHFSHFHHVVSTVASLWDRVGQPLFLAPHGHTACQGCSATPAGTSHGFCPRGDGVCILPSLDHQQPHHFHVFARLRTGLGWIVGVALPSLLPPDL
jgi:hypothetical protein